MLVSLHSVAVNRPVSAEALLTEMTVMENLLTVREAALYAKTTERTIHRWIAAGDLPASRIGPKLIRIHESELARLMRPITSARF